MVTKCSKCNGSGQYRHFGMCFQCNGKGRFTVEMADIEARRLDRATVIAKVAATLRLIEKYDDSSDIAHLGALLAHADADVRERAIAAVLRVSESPESWLRNLVTREIETETVNLAQGKRAIVKSVR